MSTVLLLLSLAGTSWSEELLPSPVDAPSEEPTPPPPEPTWPRAWTVDAVPREASAGDLDWDALGQETAELLSAYLQIDSSNPGGSETDAAEWLASFLAAEGISSEILEYAPERGSLIARLEGTGEQPPLCLVSHLDTATAEPERWQHDPWSGLIDEDGVVWGRGALDMKGLGAVEFMTMALLARQGVALRRDVWLLAVADEEVSNQGIQHVAEQRWDDIGCSHVVNEGGIGIRDMFFEGQHIYTVSVGEKGVLWMRMVAEGEPGHGSVPIAGRGAPERLIRAAQAVRERDLEPVWHPALLELLDNVGAHHGGLSGAVLQRPGLVRALLKKRFLANPLTRAAVIDTANITGFGGAEKPNVLPGEVWASVDSRLQPGVTSEDMVERLTAVVDDPQVRFEIDHAFLAGVSEWTDDPFYDALTRHVVADQPDAVAGPVISVGYTDSVFLRGLGARAYGVAPFLCTQEEIATMHGDDERLSTDNLRHGLKTLYSAVLDVAAAPDAAPR